MSLMDAEVSCLFSIAGVAKRASGTISPGAPDRFPCERALGLAGVIRTLIALLCAVAYPVLADTQVDASLSDTSANQARATVDISTIGPVFQRAAGTVKINQTAGDGNVQQNSAALAASDGPSVASVDAVQRSQNAVPAVDQVLQATIETGAFEDALGIFLVNQSSGTGNSQFNGAAIAIGGISALAVVQLDDRKLQEQSTGISGRALPKEGGATVSASANLAPDAFAGARGLFQVNQAAGNNNATANTFTLSASP